MSKKKRDSLATSPSSQIDTDAESTKKRGKYYFVHKGHIGTDVGSKIIRKRIFSSAKPHDSRFTEDLLSGDEKAIFGDSTYGNKKKSKIRSAVEHPFGYMKEKLNYKKAVAKTKERNRF